MNRTHEALFILLRAGLWSDSSTKFPLLTPEEWTDLYRISAQQGVLAIAWDGLQVLIALGNIAVEAQPSREIKIQWCYNVEIIERRYYKQWAIAKEFSDRLIIKNIQTYVLKGFAIASYYPHPEHRPCGDLDCFLPGKFNEGNVLAAEFGAKVEDNYYKHSHITFKGLMIENHQFCTNIRGSRRMKNFERMLQQTLRDNPALSIGESCLLSPCAKFNGLFLLQHTLSHFLAEGITLRHVCDWILWLKVEQNNLNLSAFYNLCNYYQLDQFANLLTGFSVKYLQTEVHPEICTQSPYTNDFLQDILKNTNQVKSDREWKWRLMKFKILLNRHHWYSRVGNVSSLTKLKQVLSGFIFERNVRL